MIDITEILLKVALNSGVKLWALLKGVFENVDTKPYILHGFWNVNKA
jgi:hypothetical protein